MTWHTTNFTKSNDHIQYSYTPCNVYLCALLCCRHYNTDERKRAYSNMIQLTKACSLMIHNTQKTTNGVGEECVEAKYTLLFGI